MPQIAKIAVSAATYAIDKPYDYIAPDDACPGQRVLVPFGKGNRTCEGMILSVRQEVPSVPLKSVREVLDAESIATEREIRLALWMRQRYFCTFYDAIHTILPAAVWYNHREIWRAGDPPDEDESLSPRERELIDLLREKAMETEELKKQFGETVVPLLRQLSKRSLVAVETRSARKVHDKTVTLVSLAVSLETAMDWLRDTIRRAPRQVDALHMLAQSGEVSLHDLMYFTGVSRAALDRLEKRGILSMRQQEEYRISAGDYAVKADPITLNDEQRQVYEMILAQTRSDKPGVTALEGVTGSGKTLIYIRLAQELLRQGKTVMILVPVDLLTMTSET